VDINWRSDAPERIVVAGDWHGNGRAARNAFDAATLVGATLVIQLGDFGMWPGFEGTAYLNEVESHAAGAGIPVAWIDGNHEDFNQLLALPVDPVSGLRPVRKHVWHVPRGASWEWHDVRFRALGGATSLDRKSRKIGKSWWVEESISDIDIAAAVAGGPCDVLLTHDCPTGVDIPGIRHRSYADTRDWPVSELERAWDHRDRLAEVVEVVQPKHLWHGHFHARYSQKAVLHAGPAVAVEGLGDDGTGPRGNLMVVDIGNGNVTVLTVDEARPSTSVRWPR